MTLTKKEMAILDKFGFDIPPVGVKYFVHRPDMVDRLDQETTLCQMLGWAQQGNAFYADPKNHTCEAGTYVLGQTGVREPYINGEYGTGLQVFESPRSATRLYQHVPTIGRGVVNYVAFSTLDKLPFEPDLLVILANTSQTEILLRAMSYVTGEMWLSRYTAAIGCSWIFVYPYLNGEINYTTTGLGFGMKRRKIFPEGMQLISIPFDRLPSMLQTLQVMPWVPEPYKPDGMEYAKNLRIKLGLDKPA
jgi:uncharacterized protein (DUF169 family)